MKCSITRRFEFDSGHRVTRHESKCRNVHGHRYTAEVTVSGALDSVGRVIDFGVLKTIVGEWIDRSFDHGYIHKPGDEIAVPIVKAGMKVYSMPPGQEPTAENLAAVIGLKASELLAEHGLVVESVRLYETPNCWADWRNPPS